MKQSNKVRMHLRVLLMVALVLTVLMTLAVGTVGAQTATTPGTDAVVVATPGALESISWGAVLAGVAVAMVIQLGINLLGISVGAASINPAYDKDSASPKAVTNSTTIFAAIGALLALFAGGWLAARFAGAMVPLDGIMHGIVVWAVVMLLTIFLLSTAVGRILSGVSSLISQGLTLAGSAARGAGQVAGSVARGAGNVAGTAVREAGHVAGDAVRGVGQAVGSAAQSAGHVAEDAADRIGPVIRDQRSQILDSLQDTVNLSPEVRDAIDREDLSLDVIREEVMDLMRQAGQSPERMREQAELAVDDVTAAARAAVRHPEHIDKIVELSLRRVFRRGQSAVNDVDRDTLVKVLSERTNMSEQEIRDRLGTWEQGFEQAKTDTQRTIEEARQRYMETRHDLERRFYEMRTEVEERVEDVVHEVEYQVRETAQDATDMISAISGAAFAAIVIGALAAGIGGLLGIRTTIPMVEVEDATNPETGYVIPANTYADAGLNEVGLYLD
jgi:hypothetical protein